MYDFMQEFAKMDENDRDVMLTIVREGIDIERTIGYVIQNACQRLGCVDSWQVLACIDFLVEIGEIRVVSNRGFTQYHVVSPMQGGG